MRRLRGFGYAGLPTAVASTPEAGRWFEMLVKLPAERHQHHARASQSMRGKNPCRARNQSSE